MFDRIAHRYDLVNHLLSFGQDILWRRNVARRLCRANKNSILDVATGTADQLIAFCRRHDSVHTAIGIDMSALMLQHGRQKVKRCGQHQRILLIHGDALAIPLQDRSVDATTIVFGIRNVMDVPHALEEMHRVLKQGGHAIILEFSLPENRFLRSLYLFYFRNILPRVGGLISGDSYAYQYLNQTVETFPYGDNFITLMTAAGFARVTATPLTFGVATIYQGEA